MVARKTTTPHTNLDLSTWFLDLSTWYSIFIQGSKGTGVLCVWENRPLSYSYGKGEWVWDNRPLSYSHEKGEWVWENRPLSYSYGMGEWVCEIIPLSYSLYGWATGCGTIDHFFSCEMMTIFILIFHTGFRDCRVCQCVTVDVWLWGGRVANEVFEIKSSTINVIIVL